MEGSPRWKERSRYGVRDVDGMVTVMEQKRKVSHTRKLTQSGIKGVEYNLFAFFYVELNFKTN